MRVVHAEEVEERLTKLNKEMAAKLVLEEAKKNCGFLPTDGIKVLAADDMFRHTSILVRCNNARFSAPAYCALEVAKAVEKSGDYIRDFSLR